MTPNATLGYGGVGWIQSFVQCTHGAGRDSTMQHLGRDLFYANGVSIFGIPSVSTVQKTTRSMLRQRKQMRLAKTVNFFLTHNTVKLFHKNKKNHLASKYSQFNTV